MPNRLVATREFLSALGVAQLGLVVQVDRFLFARLGVYVWNAPSAAAMFGNRVVLLENLVQEPLPGGDVISAVAVVATIDAGNGTQQIILAFGESGSKFAIIERGFFVFSNYRSETTRTAAVPAQPAIPRPVP